MKTVFFGSPEAALPSLEALLAAGHSVELVVTQPAKPAGRGRRLQPSAVRTFADARGIPAIEPARIRTDESARDRIVAAGPDVNVVVAYGQIIPRPIHSFPRYHSLNVHFSLLPKYRGAAPVQWTVLNGDAESGVTIIELDDRMDEGDILAWEKTAVGPGETAAALEARLAVLGAGLLVRTIAGLDRRPRIPQDHGQATLAPKIHKESGRIVWTETSAAVDRRVRALADRPGAFTFVKGRRVNILRGRALGPIESYWPVMLHNPFGDRGRGTDSLRRAKAAEPGAIVWIDKPGIEVACGGGSAYLIEELQPEGKGPMPAHAFALGARIAPGFYISDPYVMLGAESRRRDPE
jgi:methionyl-tRNA formyltransferase